MATPRILILRAPGANCDVETQFAFEQAGGSAERIHINRLREHPALLHRFQILVIPGGFTYGDDAGAGKILAIQLAHFLGDALRRFRNQEKLILGICNGFQAILKAGLLMPPDEEGPLATLAHNDSGKFEDRWITLQAYPGKCPFLKGIERLYLPVAHGEGRFVCREEWLLQGLKQAGQVVLRYVPGNVEELFEVCDATGRVLGHFHTKDGQSVPYPDNPNGSQGDVAGICDATGRVLGLMPHPERHVLPTQHPQWTRNGLPPEGEGEGDGLQLFRNAVQFFQ